MKGQYLHEKFLVSTPYLDQLRKEQRITHVVCDIRIEIYVIPAETIYTNTWCAGKFSISCDLLISN